MKRTLNFKLILLLMALAMSGISRAQSHNLHIGDPRNQIATNIRVLPDTEGTIIAGYDYDISPTTGEIINSQMILMKVNAAGTSIGWQEKFGLPGANNLIFNMIITHDKNIVIVGTLGRDNVFNHNIAAIMKFNSVTGAMMWQHNLIDAAHTVGGEVFDAVTELGAAGNYALVAVGSHDAQPGSSNSMICMFDNITGNLIYDETYNIDNNSSEGMSGICTSEDGLSTYIVGAYNGDNYTSGVAHMYTPGMYAAGPYVPGIMVWNDYFDFTLPGLSVTYVNGKPVVDTGSLTLNDNFFNDVYLSQGQLLILGGSYHNYSFYSGGGESITRLDAATGAPKGNWQVQSSNKIYGQVCKMQVIDSNHVVNIQTPTNTWYDPSRWLTAVDPLSEVVITDIPNLSSGVITTVPVKYTPGGVASSLHSVLDAHLTGGSLYMAGATNDPSYGFGENDIYFVRTPANIMLDTGGTICDIADTTGQLAVPLIPETHSQTTATFVTMTYTVTPTPTSYHIDTLCGKKLLTHHTCSDSSWNMPATKISYAGINSDTDACVYNVTATGTPQGPWGMMGYLWNIGGVITWDPSTSGTDSKPVVLPYSGSLPVTVTFYSIDDAGDTCRTTRSIVLTCTKPPCYDTSCSTITVQSSGTGDGIQGIAAPNDSCTYTACAHICTAHHIVGYDWTLSTSAGVTIHHTSASTDCFTFSVPPGVTATVSVVVHIVDFGYTAGSDPCCEAILSAQVTCSQSSQCVNSIQSSLNGTSSESAATGDCTFTCTASVAPLPGWTVLSYQWSQGGPWVSGGVTYTTSPVVSGGSVTVSVLVTLVDGNGNKCTYIMSKTFTCTDGAGKMVPKNPANQNSDGNQDIAIYPNPTDDAVTISSSQANITNIQVIDVNGKKLINKNFTNAKTANISLSTLPAGSYLFRVNNSSSKVVTKAN